MKKTIICGRKKNMKKEKYEKGRSVNQRSGSTEKAGQRRENDAKSQELRSAHLLGLNLGYMDLKLRDPLTSAIFAYINAPDQKYHLFGCGP